jgi:hypothetical protein
MTTTGIRVVTIVGTRPEIIRLSRVIARLDDNCHHILVHTGQNYDQELSAVFFNEMSIREPDYNLSVDTSTVGRMIGEAIGRTEEVLTRERPDAVLVLGDTNSAVAALIAKRMGITVFHMEAGNRCFDANVPEEVNRRVIDHFADINLVYTEHARRNLLAEGGPRPLCRPNRFLNRAGTAGRRVGRVLPPEHASRGECRRSVAPTRAPGRRRIPVHSPWTPRVGLRPPTYPPTYSGAQPFIGFAFDHNASALWVL